MEITNSIKAQTTKTMNTEQKENKKNENIETMNYFFLMNKQILTFLCPPFPCLFPVESTKVSTRLWEIHLDCVRLLLGVVCHKYLRNPVWVP